MSDQIHIEQLELRACVGVPDEERASPQRVTATISMIPLVDFKNLGDDIRRTVDYAAVCEKVKTLAGSRARCLIETLADEIATDLLTQFAIAQVRVEIRKFILPDVEHVSISVTRSNDV